MKRLILAGAIATACVPSGGISETASDYSWLPSQQSSAPATEPAVMMLQERASTLARSGAAHVGLAAIDLTSGEMVSVNGGELFPMASTVKVAIAAAFLRGVQDGRLSLDSYYSMSAAEQRAASRLGDMQRHRGALTGAQLLELMLVRSDNSAADMLLRAVGGTRAVSRWLTSAGVEGQRIDRSIAELLSDHETQKRMRVGRGRHRRWISVSVPRAAPPGDHRDSSTPEAMAALLVKLRNGELLDAERTDYLFDIMSRCRTGPRRIRGMLPQGTPVAHKTGTMNGITDDVGIVTLPNGHQLAVAVFVRGGGGVGAHDRRIAQLSRLLYDGFSVTTETARLSPAGSATGARPKLAR